MERQYYKHLVETVSELQKQIQVLMQHTPAALEEMRAQIMTRDIAIECLERELGEYVGAAQRLAVERAEYRRKAHEKCNEADCNYPDCDCWARKDHRPLLDRHKQLGAFYDTDDYAAMVDSMARQIEKLQERHALDDGKPPMLRA